MNRLPESRLIHLSDCLEDLPGRKVDLVAADGIKENRSLCILRNQVHVVP